MYVTNYGIIEQLLLPRNFDCVGEKLTTILNFALPRAILQLFWHPPVALPAQRNFLLFQELWVL